MANYNKSFNFRNGVQVDNNNFIVNPNGLVGIGTSMPREFLDVYGTAKITGLTTTNALYAGIATVQSLTAKQGISVSGVVTATSFSGSASGLTGIYAIAVNGWYITNSGISTTSNVGIGTTNPQGNLQIGTGVTINSNGNAIYSGILTASSFIGSGSGLTLLDSAQLTGTISNTRLPSNINVSGIITALTRFNGNLTGNVTGIASTALSLSGTPNISVGFVTATQFIGNLTGIASTALSLNGSPSITVTNISAGIITCTNIISGISSVGVSTVSTRLYAESIGVGTISPLSDIHVKRTSTSTLQLTSDSAESIIALGRSTTLIGNNGALRFGNTSATQRYSTTKSLDIINYDTGNINSYLHLGSAGINTGSFNWIYGQVAPSQPLMALTYDGNLGIGITIPTNNLHVVGTSRVTGNAYFENNLYVDNNLTVYGNTSFPSGISANITGNLSGNVNSVSGISTFNNIIANTSIGIGEVASTYNFEIGSGKNKVVISTNAIGIATDKIYVGTGIDVSRGTIVADRIGIGTTNPKCYVDFSNPAGVTGGSLGNFMLPPKVSSSERVGLSTIESALIYNTTSKRLELYIGTAWVGIATIA